ADRRPDDPEDLRALRHQLSPAVRAVAGDCRSRAPEGPLDGTQEMCLETIVRPDVRLVAEGRIDHPTATVALRPRQRVIAIGTLAATDVDGDRKSTRLNPVTIRS